MGYIKSFIRETWPKRYSSSPSEDMITLMWSFVVSIYSIGGLLGSLSAGYLSVRFGRKRAMLSANIPALLSAALMGLSRLCGSFEMIIAGRLFSGSFVTAGLALNIHLMYAGECAPRNLRSSEYQIHPNFLENTHKPAHSLMKHTRKTRSLWWIHSPQHRLLLSVLCQRWSIPFPGHVSFWPQYYQSCRKPSSCCLGQSVPG
uniref:Major facilitator superfamily (MFS) profile domain-containing protein n=1 Tax=Bubo bubo TaxID=30461 RepID=A0A8C0E5X8_BUBBB